MTLLNDTEKRELLAVARSTVEHWLAYGEMPPRPPVSEALLARAGAFVTLHNHGQLRGCIGTIEPSRPLVDTVQEMAVAAASRDFRFAPVSADELPAIDFEISVLGAHEPVAGPEDIEVGVHGLIIERRGRRGLLLPQVATEYDWDAAKFLSMVCQKAGLHEDAWRSPDAVITRFTASVFGER